MPLSRSSSPTPIPRADIPNFDALYATPARGIARFPATELMRIIRPDFRGRILSNASLMQL